MSTLNVNNINEAGGVDAVISSGVLDSGSLPTGSILQVVSTTKTDRFITTSATPVPITGAEATITPSSSSSKIYIVVHGTFSSSVGDTKGIQLYRDATNIGGGTPEGSRLSNISSVACSSASVFPWAVNYLDSPSTTSAVTYSLKTYADVAGRTTTVGGAHNNPDNAQPNGARTALTVTLMEVAA